MVCVSRWMFVAARSLRGRSRSKPQSTYQPGNPRLGSRLLPDISNFYRIPRRKSDNYERGASQCTRQTPGYRSLHVKVMTPQLRHLQRAVYSRASKRAEKNRASSMSLQYSYLITLSSLASGLKSHHPRKVKISQSSGCYILTAYYSKCCLQRFYSLHITVARSYMLLPRQC